MHKLQLQYYFTEARKLITAQTGNTTLISQISINYKQPNKGTNIFSVKDVYNVQSFHGRKTSCTLIHMLKSYIDCVVNFLQMQYLSFSTKNDNYGAIIHFQ